MSVEQYKWKWIKLKHQCNLAALRPNSNSNNGLALNVIKFLMSNAVAAIKEKKHKNNKNNNKTQSELVVK